MGTRFRVGWRGLAFLFFIDESGHDRNVSPYYVLASVAVEDSRIWNLITALKAAEVECFGERITHGLLELKAKKILKTKVFKHAKQMSSIAPADRTRLARECLIEGRAAVVESREAKTTRKQITALAQAKIAFVGRVLELCAQHQARAFASIVDRDAPDTDGDFLRKDYSYLFERFFYFLEERAEHHQGLVVFDELEHSKSHILIDQMDRYFQHTVTGRLRASRIVPEPFFVHSELTSLVQVADLLAYIISWGVRVATMARPARSELAELAAAVLSLRYTQRNNEHTVWGFAVIDDLRPRDEKQKQEKAMPSLRPTKPPRSL
jgi:hypothetical protein